MGCPGPCRTSPDFAALRQRSQPEGWALVALDLGVDTATPAGELVANVVASVAQWERRVMDSGRVKR
ncbi:recombinase family protein [Nostocoides sp. F2B08]|uniref:recombinase family protein n=1 Tax=Nostocoides sp. F2B08 TaxID=2653936 RepID=UPI00351A4765